MRPKVLLTYDISNDMPIKDAFLLADSKRQFSVICPHCDSIVWLEPVMKDDEVKSIRILKEGCL